MRRWEGTDKEHLCLQPISKKGSYEPMFGGNYGKSYDSEFRSISYYPLPIHDRFERFYDI